jgi:hypothetical protein
MALYQLPGFERPIELPDGMSQPDVDRALNDIYEEKFPESQQNTELGPGGQFINKFMRAGGEAIGQTVEAAGRVGSAVSKALVEGGIASESLLNELSRDLKLQNIREAGAAISEGAREAFPTNPKYEGSFWLDTIPSGIASTLTAAVPGVGPVLYGLQAGESAAKEAEAAGRPEMADIAFVLNAPLGGLSQKMIGAGTVFWSAIKKARKAGMEAATFTKDVLWNMVKGGFGEGLQEGVEQAGGNVIADVTYDPGRPWLKGAPTAAAAGAVIGAGAGGAGGALGNLSVRRDASAQAASVGATATAQALQATPVAPKVQLPGEQVDVDLLFKNREAINAQAEQIKQTHANDAAKIGEEINKILAEALKPSETAAPEPTVESTQSPTQPQLSRTTPRKGTQEREELERKYRLAMNGVSVFNAQIAKIQSKYDEVVLAHRTGGHAVLPSTDEAQYDYGETKVLEADRAAFALQHKDDIEAYTQANYEDAVESGDVKHAETILRLGKGRWKDLLQGGIKTATVEATQALPPPTSDANPVESPVVVPVTPPPGPSPQVAEGTPGAVQGTPEAKVEEKGAGVQGVELIPPAFIRTAMNAARSSIGGIKVDFEIDGETYSDTKTGDDASKVIKKQSDVANRLKALIDCLTKGLK